MTELHVIDGGRPETLTEAVAKRLRGQLAERRIKHKLVMDKTGWGKTTVYRKVNGISALDTDEMELLWQLFGISPTFLLTGQPDTRPWPGPDGGGVEPPGRIELPTYSLRVNRSTD